MIDRPNKNIKPFASNSSAGERTVFGNLSIASDSLSDNLNENFLTGWEAGLAENGYPPSQYFNALGYTSTALSAYLFQTGVPEWNALQDYKKNAFVNYQGALYVAQGNIEGNANNANPATDTTNWKGSFDNHINDTNNPHRVTKEQVGLGNVDNTSDLDKPISNATQAALNTKEPAFDILPVSKGGTGTNNGISNVTQAALDTKEPAFDILPIEKGGTGTNNGISNATQAALNTKEPAFDILPVEKGGTGTNNGTTYVYEGGVLRVTSPKGAAYTYDDVITGAIKITLPQSWTRTMMKMKVEVYGYLTQKSFIAEIAAYNYNIGEVWAGPSAHIISGGDTNYTIRFGHDGSKCCVYIGETDSQWSYPKITVTEVQVGHYNFEPEKWISGWNIGIVDNFQNVSATLTNVQLPTRTELLANRYISPLFDVTWNTSYPITHNLGTKDVKIIVYAEIVSNPSQYTAIGRRYVIGEGVNSWDDYVGFCGVVKEVTDENTVTIKTAPNEGASLGYIAAGGNDDAKNINWTNSTMNSGLNHAKLMVVVERL